MDNQSILIVDDESSARHFCADFLSENGYQVDSASNGKDALSILSKKTFDILLTDIQMPEMDGIALLKESKNLYPETEVILMTSYGALPSAIEAIRAGAYDYVTKPFTIEFMLNTIHRCMEKIELQRQLKATQLKLIEQEKLVLLGSVSAWLSHRMRNSLSVIFMCTNYLQQKIANLSPTVSLQDILRNGNEAEFKEVLSAIADKVKTVEKMTSDFINYSRPYELQKTIENINTILKNVAESLRSQIQIQKIRLIEQFDPQLPDIACDPDILHETFENILLNALQAMNGKENQFLVIQTEFLRNSDSYRGETLSLRGQILVSISNSGSVISPEIKDKIFTPFFSTKENGSGLGLAIAKKTVEQHGGKIFAENAEYEGHVTCSMRIIFPLQT